MARGQWRLCRRWWMARRWLARERLPQPSSRLLRTSSPVLSAPPLRVLPTPSFLRCWSLCRRFLLDLGAYALRLAPSLGMRLAILLKTPAAARPNTRRAESRRKRPKMPQICALITIAMQLICFVNNEVICTDNESLMQLLSVPSCERVVSHQDRGDASSFVQER